MSLGGMTAGALASIGASALLVRKGGPSVRIDAAFTFDPEAAEYEQGAAMSQGAQATIRGGVVVSPGDEIHASDQVYRVERVLSVPETTTVVVRRLGVKREQAA